MADQLTNIVKYKEMIVNRLSFKFIFTPLTENWKKQTSPLDFGGRSFRLCAQLVNTEKRRKENVWSHEISLSIDFEGQNSISEESSITIDMLILKPFSVTYSKIRHVYKLMNFGNNLCGIRNVLHDTCLSTLFKKSTNPGNPIELSFSIMMQEPNLLKSLIQDLDCLLKSAKDTNFTITTKDGKVLNVHKDILTSRCQIFKRMIDTDMLEKKNNNIHLNWNVEIVQELLDYIYTCKIVNIKNPVELFKLAHYLQLTELQKICQSMLAHCININNFIEVFQLAETFDLMDLFDKTKLFILKNLLECIKDKNLESFLRNNIKVTNAGFILKVAYLNEMKDLINYAMEFITNHYSEMSEKEKDEIKKLPDLAWRFLDYSLSHAPPAKRTRLSRK